MMGERRSAAYKIRCAFQAENGAARFGNASWVRSVAAEQLTPLPLGSDDDDMPHQSNQLSSV
jgi:hypothetical protein